MENFDNEKMRMNPAAPENGEALPGAQEPKEVSIDNFLATIGELAMKRNHGKPDAPCDPGINLSTITPDDYPEVAVMAAERARMEELQKIVREIESRPQSTKEIRFDKPYKINYAGELNRAQLEAVTTTSGPVLVIAGAGSGKTRVIVHRVAYLLENGIFPSDILLLTFTRKAAKEMLGRAQGLLQQDSVQRVFGGTFHSFANYVLRKYSGLLDIPADFTIIDTQDSADIIDLVKSELKLVSKEKAFPRKQRIQEIISASRNRNIPISVLIENEYTGLIGYIPEIEMINKGYKEYKRISKVYDFDDLMDMLRDSLRDHAEFRRKIQQDYKYIMVDEYQDTNVVQKEIVEFLADGHRNIMVVGDDSQSIYAFRGACYENILRFPQKYPDCAIVKIEENYRSSQKVLDLTNDIILNAKIGYKKRLYSKNNSGSLPVVAKLIDQQTEAEFIVTKILEYREKGIELDQIAVLVRAFWHARYIEAELTRRGIPYITVGGLAFNERKHVKDVISYLRIIQNPYDAVAWHRVLKHLDGVGIVTAREIVRQINSANGLDVNSFDRKKFSKGLRDLVNMLRHASDNKVSLPGKLEMIKDYYSPILQSLDPEYQIRLLDIGVLIDLAGNYDSAETFLTDFALDPPSKRFGDKTTPLIDETEDKPLTISTIHSAKGLEWYGVFIPHALDGMIPSVQALNNIEELEEERRLFYVACSRAKEELIITMPSFVSNHNGFLSYPSRFLVEIGKDKYRYG